MEYMGNKEYWNDKFSNRCDNPLSPEQSLVENMIYFNKGTVLDIACGDGRNALFLLNEGFRVTGVDFSNKALERLNMFAKRNSYLINTMQVDLNMPNSLDGVGIFDNIVINHYRLNKQHFENIDKHLTYGGILFICGFGHKHMVNSKIKEEDLIQSSDFENLKNIFELIKYTEYQNDIGFFVTYIFRKRKS
jgi:2-polyprenyl-3-methyl-5-hydroxy-6-metoxy-1,4-benzoquinol methylase